jgi:hypothetical protein
VAAAIAPARAHHCGRRGAIHAAVASGTGTDTGGTGPVAAAIAPAWAGRGHALHRTVAPEVSGLADTRATGACSVVGAVGWAPLSASIYETEGRSLADAL